MGENKTKTSLTTQLQHPAHPVLAADNHPLIAPVYHSVKFHFDSVQAINDLYEGKRQGYLYSRVANPTVRQVETSLAHLQGCEDGIAFGSGIAAIFHTLMALLKQGDHVLLFYECYAPSRLLLRDILARFGVTHTLVHVDDHAAIQQAFVVGKTRLVLFESPTNPILKIADVEFIARTAKAAGALIVMDNTFAGPHHHLNCGVDLYIHSLTKYVIGMGDAMGGIVCGAQKLIGEMRRETFEFGAVMDPAVADKCLRGLKTYLLRYEAQSKSALYIAQILERTPGIANVRYPGLKSHPQYALAKKQITDDQHGAVISYDVGQNDAEMVHYLNQLKLTKLTGSLGTTETLIAPCLKFYARDLPEPVAVKAEIHATTVRLSVGLEDPGDILKDIVPK